MLGFCFSVHEAADFKPTGPQNSSPVASWDTGLFGTSWLEDLVSEGKARELTNQDSVLNFTYAVASGVLMPIIRSGIPRPGNPVVIGDDYVMPANWLGNLTIDGEKVSSFSDETELIVDVWDMS